MAKEMTEHTYPSRYGRGQCEDLDSAWDILDRVKPGVIPEDVRAFLAGCIVGLMARVRSEAKK